MEAPPVVVLGHGLGATREMRLDAFAERFADAGIAALAFTYRHFGDSGGEPRQLLSIKRQLADWDAAIAHLETRTDVDSSRLAVWGSSFGGGHSITVASRHPELRAAVAQCPVTDGLASARALGPKASMRLMPLVARDLLSSVRGCPPVTIPLAAPAGSPALMNAPDALPGYEALIPTGATFVNEAAARVVATIPMYRPGRQAKSIRSPILFCVSNTDSVTPPAETIRYARTAPRGEIKTYDAGHFDFYLGDAFEALVRDQVEFLTRHLALTPPSSKTDAGGQRGHRRPIRSRTFFDVVERERPSYLSAVPTIYTVLAALADAVQPDTSSLRFAICGGAPAAVAEVELDRKSRDRAEFATTLLTSAVASTTRRSTTSALPLRVRHQ